MYLSQMKPVRVKESTALAVPQPYCLDRNCQGGPLTIAGHTYPRGLGVHATSELTFKLAKAFRTFEATIGIDSDAGGGRQRGLHGPG